MSYTVNVLLRSEYWGQGKTIAAVSFRGPDGTLPRRLLVDTEYRDAPYQSPDTEDHPEKLQYAFDFYKDVFGELSAQSLVKLYQDICGGNFGYDVMLFDNVAIFQDVLFVLMAEKPAALAIAKGIPAVYARNRLFLDYKFKSTDPGGYYPLLKSVVKELLLACRKHDVHVVATTESRNVWKKYGTRDQEMLGQTAKAWDPWFQFSDVVLVLSRIKGDRMAGTAKMTAVPTATLDTFNTKCSIPGIVPEFVFDNWATFWEMADKRKVPSASDFAKVHIETGSTGEEEPGLQTIDDAKKSIARLAVAKGIMASIKDAKGAAKLKELGAAQNLDLDNALAQYEEWVALINGQEAE